jgi:hypothetical protein
MLLNAILSSKVPGRCSSRGSPLGTAIAEFRSPIHQEESSMKKLVVFSTLLASVFAFAGMAEAKGCIKGAFIGGIAGKMAGHGKVGAAAGCAIGHHRAAKKTNAERQQ